MRCCQCCIVLVCVLLTITSALKLNELATRALKTGTAVVAAAALSIPHQVMAREIAAIPTSGFVFKDTLKVSAFEDPQLKGISIFLR